MVQAERVPWHPLHFCAWRASSVGLYSQAVKPPHGLQAACLHRCQLSVLAQLALSHAEALLESPDRVVRLLHLQCKRHLEAEGQAHSCSKLNICTLPKHVK